MSKRELYLEPVPIPMNPCWIKVFQREKRRHESLKRLSCLKFGGYDLLSHKINFRTISSFTFQPVLRPALPCVYGPLDYREQRALFERIDGILAV